MKNKAKKIGIGISIFIVMIIYFILSMIITYSLPNEPIRQNILESRYSISQYDNTPIFKKDIQVAQYDLYSDFIILNTAINLGQYENQPVIERAFLNSRYTFEESDKVMGHQQLILLSVIDEAITLDKEVYNNQEYYRYWQGIQTIVRPLMTIFTYEETRFFLMIVMFILLAITTHQLSERLGKKIALAYLFSMLVTGFIAVPMIFSYTGIYLVMLLGILILNVLIDKKKEKFIPYLFILIGGFASFLDMLTVPIITVIMPLIVLVLYRYDSNKNFKNILLEILKLGIIWGISYGMTFFVKWVIAEIISNQNVFESVINNLIYRSVGYGAIEENLEELTIINSLVKNFNMLYNNVFIVFAIIGIITWVVAIIKNKVINKKSLKLIVPLGIFAITPYIIYTILIQHSIAHAHISFRMQMITIFTILAFAIKSVKKEKNIDKAEY